MTDKWNIALLTNRAEWLQSSVASAIKIESDPIIRHKLAEIQGDINWLIENYKNKEAEQ